ncbi:hypothetical protein B0H11DRAFT_1923745 [Mycena galericulata]|nr:hypothetical protein B0H11DRAFT_1923745 [Mycena galericulata]
MNRLGLNSNKYSFFNRDAGRLSLMWCLLAYTHGHAGVPVEQARSRDNLNLRVGACMPGGLWVQIDPRRSTGDPVAGFEVFVTVPPSLGRTLTFARRLIEKTTPLLAIFFGTYRAIDEDEYDCGHRRGRDARSEPSSTPHTMINKDATSTVTPTSATAPRRLLTPTPRHATMVAEGRALIILLPGVNWGRVMCGTVHGAGAGWGRGGSGGK